ncbi:MAG: hypothetical protein DHS20C05_17040 [Hyphococcus sp.]|nr:MAG: hypothetical protein DHS20C05_17040 [Marinicaulis sp.]
MMVARQFDGWVKSITASLHSFREDENGATAIEYSLIVGLIFLTIVSAVRSYSESTSEMYDEITTTLEGT